MKKIFQGLLATLIFTTPLIFTTQTHEIFEFPKMFFVYIVGSLLIFLFLISLVWESHKLPAVATPVLLYVVSFMVSALVSSHRYTSLWGYYTRFNGGLTSLLVFFGIYVVLISKTSPEGREALLGVALLGIVPVSIYGIFQHLGGRLLSWQSPPSIRVFSTFGQPNWLAQYLAMLLPLILHFLLETRQIFWKIVYTLGFMCLWFTYSLSGILGFLVGISVYLVLRWFRKRSLRDDFWKILVLGIVQLVIVVSSPGIFKAKFEDVLWDTKKMASDTESVVTEVVPGNKVSDPGFIRFGLWRGTWDLIVSTKKNFILGTGPGTFPYAFQKFRVRSLNYSSEWNFVFNKPHNYYLETWSERGIVGLVSYLALIWFFIKKSLSSKSWYLLPGGVAFFVTNLFGWPVVVTSLLWWFWLAVVSVGREAGRYV